MSQHQECVILLHGLARSPRAMRPLELALASDYQVINQGYPSRYYPIETLSDMAISKALAQCEQATKIHFVTHSLGGILVRQYLSQNTIPQLGSVVMLGPPNQGSEVVDKLSWLPPFAWLNGPAGKQLATKKDSIPKQLGAANFDVGVIAGCRSINLILSLLIPGADDGKVSVAHTHLQGMKDHLVLPVTHPLMMRNKQVIQQVQLFLKHGKFDLT